jgi:hypothetical protein
MIARTIFGVDNVQNSGMGCVHQQTLGKLSFLGHVACHGVHIMFTYDLKKFLLWIA